MARGRKNNCNNWNHVPNWKSEEEIEDMKERERIELDETLQTQTQIEEGTIFEFLKMKEEKSQEFSGMGHGEQGVYQDYEDETPEMITGKKRNREEKDCLLPIKKRKLEKFDMIVQELREENVRYAQELSSEILEIYFPLQEVDIPFLKNWNDFTFEYYGEKVIPILY